MEIEKIRHSLAHILAEAVSNLYPRVKFGMGPAVENGFYYDFDFESDKFSEEDLDKIEKEMKKIIKLGKDFTKKEIPRSKAAEIFQNQPYKQEILKKIENEKAELYKNGDFVDLCKGPHINSTRDIPENCFQLDRVSGAYWKGDENNNMLTRIYGLAFEDEKKLQDFLKLREEMKEKDHRKLGKQLDLFYFSDLVGPGLPMFTPKGTFIKETLQKKVEKICSQYGFEKVITPHLSKIKLFEISGHAKKFSEELFSVSSPKGHEFVMKPVQCPHQTQIYASKKRSYKDLPIRYMESEKQYRAEKQGEVGGLNRVYAITVEDGHSFCSTEQVKGEIKGMVSIIKDFYSELGLWGNHWVALSVRDYKSPKKYIGSEKDWDVCENILEEVSNEMGLNAQKIEGEAALYGPKLDFMFKDALGKEIQIPTVQIDFATPKRFNLLYTDKNGEEKNPVMVHRAILGSYERFMALIIEYFGGAFPFWLSPEQIWILPISEKYNNYAQKLKEQLKNYRVKVKDESSTIGKKIREGETQKIPYLLIVGEKEIKNNSVSVRQRKKGDIGEFSLSQLIKKVEKVNKK